MGRTIPEMFTDDGEAGFRAIEHEVLEALLRVPGRTVISTGGGAVLSPSKCALMRERGSVVWLRGRPETVLARVGARDNRPPPAAEPDEAVRRGPAGRQSPYASAADLLLGVDRGT